MTTPLEKWVEEQARFAKPSRIYWCDGTEEEARRIVEIGMSEEKVEGQPVFHPLNQKAFPHSYLHRSHPTRRCPDRKPHLHLSIRIGNSRDRTTIGWNRGKPKISCAGFPTGAWPGRRCTSCLT